MNLPEINANLPCLRVLTSCQSQKRRLSSSTNTKSYHSSSSIQSSCPVLIQLCIYPNEDYAFQTMKILFSSRYNYSPNVCDEFGCNVLMYTLRYQRYRLFYFLLNEISLDLNLRSKDRQGNTILHYAIIYGQNNTQIMENLIEKFNKFGINIDERNNFGFTPLLLAIFCGRYDLVLTLLTKTDASPFVRDYIQLKNMIDYLEIDRKHRQFMRTIQNKYV
jgi:ankyrin repeat protein